MFKRAYLKKSKYDITLSKDEVIKLFSDVKDFTWYTQMEYHIGGIVPPPDEGIRFIKECMKSYETSVSHRNVSSPSLEGLLEGEPYEYTRKGKYKWLHYAGEDYLRISTNDKTEKFGLSWKAYKYCIGVLTNKVKVIKIEERELNIGASNDAWELLHGKEIMEEMR